MDRLSVWMVRTSLVYLVAGTTLGATLLGLEGAGQPLPLPRLGIVHGHLLFIGWLVQFALGIAYWLLPRRRQPGNPQAYRERWGFLAYGCLNLGLILRTIAEPLLVSTNGTGPIVIIAALLQLAGIALIAGQLWKRVVVRKTTTEG